MNALEKTINKILDSVLGIIIFIVSLAAFYLPYEAEIIPEVLKVLPYVRYVCGAVLIVAFFLLYISRMRVFRDNWFLVPLILFLGVLVYSTFLNGTDMQGALGSKGVVALFAVLTVAVFFRVNPKKYLLIAFFMFLAVNILNTYCIFRFWGTGLWEVWHVSRNPLISIVGNYNGGIEFVLPMAVCGSAYAHRFGKWMEAVNYPAMLMSIVMAFKVDSETQKAAFLIILIFMVITDITIASRGFAKVVRWIFNPVLWLLATLGIYVTIVWMNLTEWFTRFGLSRSMHGRRKVWNMAIDWIGRKPVWGSGFENVDQKAQKIVGYAHCHCLFLEIPYMTGIVGSIFFAALIITAVVALLRCRNSRVALITSAMFLALCIANLFETYGITFFVLSLGLIYYISKTCGDEEGKKRKTR